MKESSRTANTFKNMVISLILYAISYVAVFISRTFFVRILGNDYLSISGLFTNVITLVSFTELGLGSASVFCLYQPIADKDYIKIRSLLSFFGNLYKGVALITLVLGGILIPFLPYLVDMEDMSFTHHYLIVVYMLFIINTSASYIFVQKKLFLTADQKNYIANTIQQTVHIIQLVIQTLFLVFTHNYIGYLIIQIICTIITNVVISKYVERKYRELLSSKNIYPIEKNEKKNIAQNIGSIFFYKIGAVILNGTDNIIVSVFVKTIFVGLCSNYTLVINAINSVIMQCFNGIGASIGNHTINAAKEEQEKVFCQLDIFCVVVYSFCSVCLAVLLNRLIFNWFGKDYLLSQVTVLSLVLAFYVTGVNQIPSLYRTSLGLFKNARFFPLLAAISNIVLSIILSKVMGLSGVFWATSIVRFLFFTLVDSRLTYVKGFEMSPIKYYVKYLYRVIVLVVTYFLVENILKLISISSMSIGELILHTCICVCITALCLLAAYSWNEEFKLLLKRLKVFIKPERMKMR